MRRIWVGLKQSDTANTGTFFDHSITFYGNGHGNNSAFSESFDERINTDNYNNKALFIAQSMKSQINISRCEFIFYNAKTAHRVVEIEPSLEEYIVNLNSKYLISLLDDKLHTRIWLSNKIPVIETLEILAAECTYTKLETLLSHKQKEKYIVQENNSSGGHGTFLVDSQTNITSRLNHGHLHLASKFIPNGISINYHLLIQESGYFVFPPSVQIVSEVNQRIIYKGADFGCFRMLSVHQQETARKYVEIVGKALQVIGYLGVCGVDLLVTEESVYFVEINGRYQASTNALNRALLANGLHSIQALDYCIFKKQDHGMTQEALDKLTLELSFYKYEYDHKISHKFLVEKSELMRETKAIDECYLDGYRPDQDFQEGAYAYTVMFPSGISSINREHTLNIHPNVMLSTLNEMKLIDYQANENYLIMLKIALLNQGIRITKIAMDSLHKTTGYNESVFSSVDILVDKLVRINCPINVNLVSLSPYTLDLQNGQYVIAYNGAVLCQALVEGKKQIDEMYTKKGTAFRRIGFISGDRLRLKYQARCGYKDMGKSCRFCPSNSSGKKEKDFSLEDIREVFDYCVENEDFRHILIGGGIQNPEKEDDIILRIIQMIREKTEKPIYLMALPPQDPLILEEYYKTGLNEVAFNLEVFDRTIARNIMPAKGAISLKRYMRAFEKSVELWGSKGNVRTMFVVGLEPISSLMEGISQMCKMGVQPMLSVFRPIASCEMSKIIPPSNEALLDIYYKAKNICTNYGLSLGPLCKSCQNNTLSITL